jgi:hypothetical protein
MPLNLPDGANLGDPGHKDDHNLIVAALTSLDNTKAENSAVVHTTSDETVQGIKTFTHSPIIPAPSTANQAARKTDVDSVGLNSDVKKGIYNIKDYGAIGDGITDDTTAINNVIATLNATTRGGTIIVPPGTYKVTAALTPFTKPIHIRGSGGLPERYTIGTYGSAILQTSKTAHTITFSIHGCMATDLFIWNSTYGNGSPITGTWPHTLRTTALPTAGSGIRVYSASLPNGVNECRIENVAVYGFYRNVDLSNALNTHLTGCSFSAPVKESVRCANPAWYDGGGTIIERCDFLTFEAYSIPDCHIKWESGGGFNVTTNTFVSGIYSAGLAGDVKYAIDIDIKRGNSTGADAFTRDIKIIGNHIESHGRSGGAGIRMKAEYGFDVRVDDIIVNSNYINTFQPTVESWSGVEIEGTSINPIRQASIVGNTFKGGGSGYSTGYGVKLTYVNDATVLNNIEGTTFKGPLAAVNCLRVDDIKPVAKDIDFKLLQSTTINGSGRLPIQVATIPTVTVNTSATLTSNVKYLQANNSSLRYLGSPVSNVGNYLGIGFQNCMRQNSTYYPYVGGIYSIGDFIDVEFETDTNHVEFSVITTPGNGDVWQYRYKLFENDEFISGDANIGLVSNATYYIKCVWPSAKRRKVRLKLQGAVLARVTLPVTSTAWKSSRYEGLTAVCQSDSFGYAYNQEGGSQSVWGHDSPYKRGLELLGMNVHNDVVSGSGFVNTQSGVVQTFQGRFAGSVAALNPDVVTVAVSVNDTAWAYSTAGSAINNYFANARALLPNAIIYGLGGVVPGNEYRGAMEYMEGLVQTACANNGCTFVKTSDYTSGSGSFSLPTGDGNSDRYVSGDRYHLVDEGSDYVAERLAQQIGTNIARRAAIR